VVLVRITGTVIKEREAIAPKYGQSEKPIRNVVRGKVPEVKAERPTPTPAIRSGIFLARFESIVVA
jgi:hypothetical protein